MGGGKKNTSNSNSEIRLGKTTDARTIKYQILILLLNTFSFYNIMNSIDQDQLDRNWKSDQRGKLGDKNLLPSPCSRTNLTGLLHAM